MLGLGGEEPPIECWELAGSLLAAEYVEKHRRRLRRAFEVRAPGSILVALAVVAALVVYYRRVARPIAGADDQALGLLIGGALGNLVDRWRLGYVVDFVAVGVWPKFNLADAVVTIGVPLRPGIPDRRKTADARSRPVSRYPSMTRPRQSAPSESSDASPDSEERVEFHRPGRRRLDRRRVRRERPSRRPGGGAFELRPTRDNNGERLDRYVSDRLPDISRNYVQQLIEAGQIRVDGFVRRPSFKMTVGEVVTVEVPPPVDATPLNPQNPSRSDPLEDDDLLVLDKPAGLVVHPAAGHPRGTLVNALLFHAPDLSDRRHQPPRHRPPPRQGHLRV